jgi:MFS family permease
VKQAIAAAIAKPLAGVGLPLRQRTFRRIWIASLFSNLGQQVQAVAAAWTMLQLTHSASLVAMVQTASMLPIMLLAVPAGAIADMYDRRKVAMAALALSLSGALLLAVLAMAGLITAHLILLCCFLVGSGIALYSPAWQASASEVVGVEALPSAVALYSLSSNVARSVGPAIGGIILAVAGIVPAFSVNAGLYLPILGALYLWRRRAEPPRLPPERLDRAMISGLRYVRHAPPIRRVLLRTFITAIGGAAVYSMMPLIARELLHGGPGTFGMLLGAFGVGAVTAALNIGPIRDRLPADRTVSLCAVTIGAAILIASLSRFTWLTAFVLLFAGGGWMVSISLFNISVQLYAPRWVGGRALATFQAAAAGGLAGGSWLWGHVAQAYGVETALYGAAALMLAAPLMGIWLRLPAQDLTDTATQPPSSDPIVQLDITGRSGPVIIEIEYEVDPALARDFYHLIRHVQRSRERNGAFDVSIARDVTTPSIWVERFQYPTWNDYLRARDRPTAADRDLRDRSLVFHIGEAPPRVRRMLERPFGSVRWREEAPDYGTRGMVPMPISSAAGG